MKYLIILLSLLLIYSCAGGKKTIEQSGESQAKGQYDESFDPLSLDDDDISITKDEKEPTTESPQSLEEPVTDSAEPKEVDGWRVQILATKNIENATLIHQEASDQFELSNLKAYLIFEAPLYKVRIGNAKNRNEAEEIRDLARDYGYREAFIVRSKILTDPAVAPEMD